MNAEDIGRLLELHQDKGGTLKGRRFGVEVLNKSAIVLLTSFREAYCEDVAAEALDHVVTQSSVSRQAADGGLNPRPLGLAGSKTQLTTLAPGSAVVGLRQGLRSGGAKGLRSSNLRAVPVTSSLSRQPEARVSARTERDREKKISGPLLVA